MVFRNGQHLDKQHADPTLSQRVANPSQNSPPSFPSNLPSPLKENPGGLEKLLPPVPLLPVISTLPQMVGRALGILAEGSGIRFPG